MFAAASIILRLFSRNNQEMMTVSLISIALSVKSNMAGASSFRRDRWKRAIGVLVGESSA
jgi:hypothetical protein